MDSEISKLESITKIKHYEIKKEISRGGMGVVYLAEDTKLSRNVAIKIILSTSQAIYYKRFQREAMIYASLSHPNIVKIYDVGIYKNKPYIIMEYIQGKPILQYIKEQQHVDYREHANLLSQIAQAVHYIHKKNIIHRDIKSDNILVKENGIPILIDFGIARDCSKTTFQEKLTQTGSLLGTVNIMSPEQALGDKIDYRTDIYSLGTVLYQLCTGQYPFDMSDTYSTLCAITTDQPITPSTIKPDIPKSLDQIILRCLEKKPENRYKTAQHLANDLKQFFYKKDTTNTLYGLQLQYKAKKRKTILILSSFIFMICMAGSYFFLQQLNILQKTTEDLSMIIACENTLSQLQLQFSMHIDYIQEACHEPSIYTNLFKNMTETTQYKNIKNNERYSHNLEQRLEQTPWNATLYKDSTLILTEMAKVHFENHEKEKAQEYQKQAEEKLRKYFSIQPYNQKIFTKFTEQYLYILNSSTIQEDLYISQEFFNVNILSSEILELSDLFPYADICTTYLQKEKSTWNRDKFDVCKKIFQDKASKHNILLQNILTPLLLAPEFCKLYQEDKDIRELFQQKREQAIQNHDIQTPIKQLLAQYYLTRDTEYLSYIFTYTHKYIPTLHYILNQDEEYFFRFLAAYALSICKEEQGKEEQGKEEQGKEEQGKEEQGKEEQGKEEQIKDARDALEETMENDENNLDSAILSYVCAKKMDLQIEYPNFLNIVPTNIADTTKLIFLQYILEIADKDKIKDVIDEYIPIYLQDKNPNIVLLAMYFMLKTMDTIPIEEFKINFREYKIEYAKTIQQIWKTIKAQEEKHILFFIIFANKFSDVIKQIHAMRKNIITDIHSILEQTKNPDIQENALKFLQHYSANEYGNIAQTWLQKEHIEESVKLFLISSIENNQNDLSSIENNQNDLIYILKSKDISSYSKVLLVQTIIKAKLKSVPESTQDDNIANIITTFNYIMRNIQSIKEFILQKNMDNTSKPFYIYIVAMLNNVPPIYNIKIELLKSPNEVDQKAILLGLGSYPFLGHYSKDIPFLKIKKKQGKVKKEGKKKKQGIINNQIIFQEDIQDKLETASKIIQPYVAYAHVMMESYEKMDALPTPECFPTKEKKWGAFYGYEKILYYDFPELPIQWNLQKKYDKFLQQLYMILQQSVGSTHEDCKLYPKEFHFFSILPTPKHIQNFIDVLTYSIQIAPEIEDIAPEIAGSMNSIYDSMLLKRYLERALVYLVASKKEKNKTKAILAWEDIKFVIQHDKTTRILQKYYALILHNALQYKEKNKDIDNKDIDNKDIDNKDIDNKDIDKDIDKAKVKEQLEYAKMLYPWDEDIIQAYNDIEKNNNIEKNKDTSSKSKDIDWIFPQY